MDRRAAVQNTVLVVEDDADNRELFQLVLEGGGYRVRVARDGQEALSALAALPLPCVIFLDLMLPVMNGLELLAALAGDPALAAIPVVVLTAFREVPPGIACKELIRKPMEMDRLLEAAARHCGRAPP
jgi:CheY-like chemotaxis protein